MTYIVGIRQLDTNAIICDTRVTWWRSNKRVTGANISLKSGLLFPGCLYAITGDLGAAGAFIKEYKRKVNGTYNTLRGLWNDFSNFSREYLTHFRDCPDFNLLLSSRCEGRPEFYVLDSKTAMLTRTDSLITLGSGKNVLDEKFIKWFGKREKEILKTINNNSLPEFTFPYFYCLWLNEMAQGEEASKLEENDVGGIFHFSWQDSNGDYAQHPAVYVLSTADFDLKTVYIWVYRVAFVDDCLVVDNPVTEAREFFFSSVARPTRDIDNYLANWDNVVAEIGCKANLQPFYYFCGLGFPQLKYRGQFGCHVTTKDNFIITKDGWLDPQYKSLIISNFRGDYSLKLQDGKTILDK